MRTSLAFTKALLVMLLVLPVSVWAQGTGGCESADSWFNAVGATAPQELRFEIRPDLSNPGARALAMGGAFSATADDSTAIIANPAGLASLSKPAIQGEVRYNTTVQYEMYKDAGLIAFPGDGTWRSDPEASSPPPAFIGGVLPIGETVVAGAFFQLNYSVDRNVNRLTTDRAKGPCFVSERFANLPTTLYVPMYNLKEDVKIYRTGVSLAKRFSPSVFGGVTVYGTWQSKDQKMDIGDPIWTTYHEEYETSGDVKVGFIAGLQFILSDQLRAGLVYSHPVEYNSGTLTYSDAFPETVGRETLRKTMLPRRIGVGLTYFPTARFSIAFDGVWVQSSTYKDGINFANIDQLGGQTPPEIKDPGNWEVKDSGELRLGLEYTISQTRTSMFTGRLGVWAESASNLRFTFDSSKAQGTTRLYDDLYRTLFPDTDQGTAVHFTGGFGWGSRNWQIDAGVDYESAVYKKWVASLLIGRSF